MLKVNHKDTNVVVLVSLLLTLIMLLLVGWWFVEVVQSGVKKLHHFGQANKYILKVNNPSTRKCEKCVKTEKHHEKHHGRRSGVFIIESEQTSYLFLVFLLFTFNR